jgi:carboxyl-terminal processing protease
MVKPAKKRDTGAYQVVESREISARSPSIFAERIMKHRQRITFTMLLITLTICIASSIQAEELPPQTRIAQQEQSVPNLAVFEEVWRIVRDQFYDPTFRGLDWVAIGERYRPLAAAAASDVERSTVINRMLSELVASHTGHYTPSDPAYYQLLDIFSGVLRQPLKRLFPDGQVTYPGIGIFTRELDGKTFISGVLDGLPARQAGLIVGDEILAANGEPFHPINSFATKVGQGVTLTIRRRLDGPTEDVIVVPARIKPNEAFLKAMDQSAQIIDADGAKIGYIHIWSYAGSQYQQLLEREVSSGKLKDADALVWDLRDGWGGAETGYLHLFTGRAPTTTLITREGRVSIANVTWRKPVAMLVNDGTRSGKEILAYGFKKYAIGEVIGSRTAGAVLAGRTSLLSDGSLLLLAVADVLVDGQRLEGMGVIPTVSVPFPLAYAQGKDPQLDRAVKVLSRAVGDGG